MKTHHYKTTIEWTGNTGKHTANYTAYERAFSIGEVGKYGEILGSADPAFRGDKTRYNPEELLLSAISSCHLLWYLHLCATHGVMVISYIDEAKGVMEENSTGSGKFTEVILLPTITVETENMLQKAKDLHIEAHKMCFIANSCNFPIKIEPIVTIYEN